MGTKRGETYKTLFRLRPPRKSKPKLGADYNVTRLLNEALTRRTGITGQEYRKRTGSRCRGLAIAKARREAAEKLAAIEEALL